MTETALVLPRPTVGRYDQPADLTLDLRADLERSVATNDFRGIVRFALDRHSGIRHAAETWVRDFFVQNDHAYRALVSALFERELRLQFASLASSWKPVQRRLTPEQWRIHRSVTLSQPLATRDKTLAQATRVDLVEEIAWTRTQVRALAIRAVVLQRISAALESDTTKVGERFTDEALRAIEDDIGDRLIGRSA